MFDSILEKGTAFLRHQKRALTELSSNKYYDLDEIQKQISKYQITEIAILWDGKTKIEDLLALPNVRVIGCFSFSLDAIGMGRAGHIVKAVMPENVTAAPGRRGWIVSSMNRYDSYSLNQFLMENGLESQFLLHHIKRPSSTRYYSYVDFFENDQSTAVHINNYLDQCYKLPFPLDIKCTLRDLSGTIQFTQQIIIPPNGIRVLRSSEMSASGFVGYLELEFEVPNSITPFLHYMVDYISCDYILSNHQSGLGLHPAGSRFTRGYVPTSEDETMEIALFQRNYIDPVPVSLILNTYANGRRCEEVKKIPDLKQNEMVLLDVKKIFKKADWKNIKSPRIEIDVSVPLHRPNYYFKKYGTRGYYDLTHGGPDLKNYVRDLYNGLPFMSESEIRKIKSLNCSLFQISHLVFPDSYGLDSVVILGNDMTEDIKNYVVNFYGPNGEKECSFGMEMNFDFAPEFNISAILKERGIGAEGGMYVIEPDPDCVDIPVLVTGNAGFRCLKKNYLTSTASTGAIDNIPFYFRGGPPRYYEEQCVTQTIDMFSRGVDNAEYDTYFLVGYPSGDIGAKKDVEYEIEIYNSIGRKRVLYKALAVNGSVILKMSDLVRETGHESREGFYTVWIKAFGKRLLLHHLLYRKADGAVALEHFYFGRFGKWL